MASTQTTAALLDTNVSASLQTNRLISLDAFRGLAVAGMILVTDPGTYSAVYRPLLHAEWNGATPTDMIFPGFLFAVGIAITLSFSSRLRRGTRRSALFMNTLRRSIVIFLLGLVLNGFPDYNLHTIRIPGVLQRIAICYFFGALLYLGIHREKKGASQSKGRVVLLAGTVAAILVFYWALLKFFPVPGFGPNRLDSLGNLGAYIDRAGFGINHLWPYGTTPGHGVTFDPEGILSTLPAVATLLLGLITGEWLKTTHTATRKALWIAGAGIILLIASWMLDPVMPVNKKIWTSTFVLLSGGVSLLVFSLFYWIIDIKQRRRWASPLLVFGSNAILAFALSNIVTTLTDRIHIKTGTGEILTLHQWGYFYGFATWLKPVHASLAYAIAIVLLNLALIYPLYRKRIFLRV
ncbi:MAG TPA: DUF5009 domain-containing protein [Pseudacidobacterium sp.]|jgi:predicted acyltransferase|nr:DUF5009 domain-containing protein [Pseudacidobacterium sp.]